MQLLTNAALQEQDEMQQGIEDWQCSVRQSMPDFNTLLSSILLCLHCNKAVVSNVPKGRGKSAVCGLYDAGIAGFGLYVPHHLLVPLPVSRSASFSCKLCLLADVSLNPHEVLKLSAPMMQKWPTRRSFPAGCGLAPGGGSA